MQSLNIFMQGLLDYAGLYPPATLSLQDSLKNFAGYYHHNHENWLGKFILPVNKIDDTILILSKQNIFSKLKNKAQFSIILSNSKSLSEYQNCLQNDLILIKKLMNQFGDTIDLQSFEILPPIEVVNSDNTILMRNFLIYSSEILFGFSDRADFYCELPFSEKLNDYLTAIKKQNENISLLKVSVKLRTGGVTPQQIPSSKEIANAIILCAEQKLPIKATAGLHVPVPNDNPQVGAKLHGFLNIFSCMLLCYDKILNDQKTINPQELEDIMTTYSYKDFKFSETGLQIGESKDRFISNQKMTDLRKDYIKSFGTCSFLEPIEHLHENHFIS
jgi:hypothetical protein